MIQEEDPLVRLVRSRNLMRHIADAADIELQFSGASPGGRPVLRILYEAMDEAADALVGLATVDPEDPRAIRALQTRIQVFESMIGLVRKIVVEGTEANDELDAVQREELLEYFSQTPEGLEEAGELGLVDRELNDA